MVNSTIWVLAAFGVYMLLMIVIGVKYAGQHKNSEDFFLGGRNLNAWVAALSAQASDMSGWLLMGLPGSIYAYGTGQAWIAVGLFIGTVCNWLLVSSRLRRYTIVAGNSLTLPMYLKNRFHDKKRILLTLSSIVIIIFFLIYTASSLTAGGKFFASVFGMDYKIAITIGALVILVYTFLGGFKAVCTTDFIQGTLMLIGLLVVPVIAYVIVGPGNLTKIIGQSGVAGGASSFLNIMDDSGKPVSAVYILSQLAWGLGYCGMPHILVRFMAVSGEKELKKSKVIAVFWVAVSLAFAVIIGIVGRAYLYPVILGKGEYADVSAENVFIEMIKEMFINHMGFDFIGGLLLCGILAAIMSTADSQLLVTASAVSEDMFKGIINKDAKDSTVLAVSRVTIVIIAVIAYIIALNPGNSVMRLVSNAWAGFGAAFGPTVLLSLYWKRINLPGAVAGIVSGAATVIVWDYVKIVNAVDEAGNVVKETLGVHTGLYSLAIGFVLSFVFVIVVSLMTKKPSEEMEAEFARMLNDNN